jgi:hypothetical protein
MFKYSFIFNQGKREEERIQALLRSCSGRKVEQQERRKRLSAPPLRGEAERVIGFTFYAPYNLFTKGKPFVNRLPQVIKRPNNPVDKERLELCGAGGDGC